MYPPDRTFVIQLSQDADPARDRMLGRAEHLDSGRRCRFDSLEQLHEFLQQVLVPATAATAQEHGESKGERGDEDP